MLCTWIHGYGLHFWPTRVVACDSGNVSNFPVSRKNLKLPIFTKKNYWKLLSFFSWLRWYLLFLNEAISFLKNVNTKSTSLSFWDRNPVFLLLDLVSTNGKVDILTLLLKLQVCNNYSYYYIYHSLEKKCLNHRDIIIFQVRGCSK